MGPKLKSAIVKPAKRRRTKRLHKELLEQLEFYVSEANLRHDGWMREIAGDRGTEPIPLLIFMSFPLVQELKADEKNIINAVENSTVLKLSDDKKHLQRRYPLPRPPHNLEQSTLYIENLPPDSTIEWIRDFCRKIGDVKHITLPRFKRSGAVKGFAFIEFSSPEDVIRACRILDEPPVNFFPNRTEKYLKRLKRLKTLEEVKKVDFETEMPENQVDRIIMEASESSTLNKSLDSATAFESLRDQDGPLATSSERKRKRRRSRAVSEAGQHIDAIQEEDTPNHIPAKKMKSLPVANITKRNSKYEPSKTSEQKSSNSCKPFTVETKKNSGRKVLFSECSEGERKSSYISENSNCNCINTDKDGISCKKHDKKSSKDLIKNENTVENGITSNTLLVIHKTSSKHCQTTRDDEQTQTIADEVEKTDRVISDTEANKQQSSTQTGFLHKINSLKRRRSLSEPTNIFNFNIPAESAKRVREETSVQTDIQPIKSLQTDNTPSNEPIKTTQATDTHSEQPIMSSSSSTQPVESFVHDKQPIQSSIAADAHSEQPIMPLMEANTHFTPPIRPLISSFDIDALISQGRQQAQAAMTKNTHSCPDFASVRFVQSVVAKPDQMQKKSRKPRLKKSERKKLRIRQATPRLVAMPKTQWSNLKKEYKRIQTENMRKLKQTLKESKETGSVFIKKHLDVLKDVDRKNESAFPDGNIGNDSAKVRKESRKRGPPTFKPGVIVRISTIQSDAKKPSKLPTIPDIKSRLNKYGGGLAYVDISPSENCGFVRFNDGETAQRAIMEEKSLALCLLTGSEEEKYWDKLLASRARKFAQERPKVRGRTKILTKAENFIEKSKRRHIRFDNDISL